MGPEGVPVTVGMDPVGCWAEAGVSGGIVKAKEITPNIVKTNKRTLGNFINAG